MHFEEPTAPAAPPEPGAGPWYRDLTRYHWFVLVVCSLGWMFDTMDQQLFNLARPASMRELIPGPAPAEQLTKEQATELKARRDSWGGFATMIFMIGWASGGLVFGILGDRI